MSSRLTNLGPRRGRGETRKEVARLDEEGLSPREIARALDVTPQAVYLHLAAIKKTKEEATA